MGTPVSPTARGRNKTWLPLWRVEGKLCEGFLLQGDRSWLGSALSCEDRARLEGLEGE